MPKPYNPQDKLMLKAKKEGYRARSVYKLQELDKKYHLLHSGHIILDLAAAPGSWLQYISQRIGPDGLAIGIDLKEISPISKNVKTFIGNITDEKQIEHILSTLKLSSVDLIVSDIAPNTSGIPGVDHYKSIELNEEITKIARKFLKRNGSLVMKVFEGQKFSEFFHALWPEFQHVAATKVSASRDRSKEIYVVALNKK